LTDPLTDPFGPVVGLILKERPKAELPSPYVPLSHLEI
jgi:hypothetical protein